MITIISITINVSIYQLIKIYSQIYFNKKTYSITNIRLPTKSQLQTHAQLTLGQF